MKEITPQQVQHWVTMARHDITGTTCVRFMGLEEARELNERFRNRDYATNVLAFASDGEGILGDIAVCVPVAEQEASEQQKSVHVHIAHLIVHGTLHLCGYDHELPADAQIMEQLETQLLQKLGYPNPYE